MKINKIIAGLLAASLMTAAVPAVSISAADIVSSGKCGDNATWTLDSEGTLKITGTGAIYDYERASSSYSITGPVTVDLWMENAVPWFEQRSEIRKIIVSEGIEALGESCFMDCDNLEEIQLPDTLSLIGTESFFHCDVLKSIDIPASVEAVYYGAFRNCTDLYDIKLPSGLTTLSASVFEDCYALTEMNIPSSVTVIGFYAFRDCKSLTCVFINNPACEIYEDYNVFKGSDKCTIYGYEGSTAQTYAGKYNITFKNIESFEIGDIDIDGSINALDASMALTEYAKSATGKGSVLYDFQINLANVNGDSAVNALDASIILSYYAYTATGGKDSFEDYLNA